MTEAEKELIMKDMANIIAERSMIVDFSVIFNQVNALIARYPQVLAEKVWEGDASLMDIDDLDKALSKYDEKQIKVYIEVQS